MPQFPVQYAQRRKRDCDPDPRHHRRHNGTQGTGRAGKLLRNIIQNAPVGIEIYNDRGRLIDINTCDLEMFGVKDPGKIRGLNLFDNPNFPEETKIRI